MAQAMPEKIHDSSLTTVLVTSVLDSLVASLFPQEQKYGRL
jgi:hypothetical protein